MVPTKVRNALMTAVICSNIANFFLLGQLPIPPGRLGSSKFRLGGLKYI